MVRAGGWIFLPKSCTFGLIATYLMSFSLAPMVPHLSSVTLGVLYEPSAVVADAFFWGTLLLSVVAWIIVSSLILHTSIQWVHGNNESFGDCALTWFILTFAELLLMAAVFAYYHYYLAQIGVNLDHFDYRVQKHWVTVSKSLAKVMGPFDLYLIGLIRLVLTSAIFAWRHTGTFVMGLLVRLAVDFLWSTLISLGILAIWGGFKFHGLFGN